MRARIDAAERIVLIVPADPDADELGSACALYAHLLRLRKTVTLFCPEAAVDTRLHCIPWSEKLTPRPDAGAELAIAFGRGAELPSVCPSLSIDQHRCGEDFTHSDGSDKEAVSISSILFQWFNGIEAKINPKMATALYAGLAERTRCFRDAGSAEVFETAAALDRSGAELSAVNNALFRNQPLSALRLKGMMFSQMLLTGNGRIALIKVDRAMLAKSGALLPDAEAVLDELLGLPTVRAALLLCENDDGSVRGWVRAADNALDTRLQQCETDGLPSLDAQAAFMIEYIEKELE